MRRYSDNAAHRSCRRQTYPRSAADKRAHRNAADRSRRADANPDRHAPAPGQGGGTSIAPPPELVGAAQRQLALYLKVSPADLPLQSANAKEWPDGALGCPQDGQAYPQVVTPGFLLIFTDAAQSVQYAVHTGRSAAQMLLCAQRPAARSFGQAGRRARRAGCAHGRAGAGGAGAGAGGGRG